MLQSKSTKILSEIGKFFSEKNTKNEKASHCLLSFIKSLPSYLIKRHLPVKTKHNAQYSNYDLLNISLLMPGGGIENIQGYIGSYLNKIYKAGKDTFYRFENCVDINWREIQYKVAQHIIKLNDRINEQTLVDSINTDEVTCLIIDDTDNKKTGKTIEFVSKIFSHVTCKCVLGQKTLVLAFWNKNSLVPIDFSMHGERNKSGNPLGMSIKQLKNRFSKDRMEGTPGFKRAQQYSDDKISSGIEMIERAVKKRFKPQYLLHDSWFFCERLLKKCVELEVKIVGMAKMAKAKYSFNGKDYTAKELLDLSQRKKYIKRCRSLKSEYAQFTVEYKGVTIKLFLSRFTKKGSWNLLITNDLKLNYTQAVKIYSKRWAIEVMFKELKQFLGFEKCQSTDFDAHIAHASQCFIQYAILSHLKQTYQYETIGQLFREINNGNKIFSIADLIWNLILEILNELAELFDFDLHEVLTKYFKQNVRCAYIMKLAS